MIPLILQNFDQILADEAKPWLDYLLCSMADPIAIRLEFRGQFIIYGCQCWNCHFLRRSCRRGCQCPHFLQKKRIHQTRQDQDPQCHVESVWCAKLLMILLVDVTILDHSIASKSLCTSTGYQWTISMISFHKSSMLQLGPQGPLPCRQVLLPQWERGTYPNGYTPLPLRHADVLNGWSLTEKRVVTIYMQ